METMSGLEGAEVPAQPGMDFSEAGFLQELQVHPSHHALQFLESCAVVSRALLPCRCLTASRGVGSTETLHLLLVIMRHRRSLAALNLLTNLASPKPVGSRRFAIAHALQPACWLQHAAVCCSLEHPSSPHVPSLRSSLLSVSRQRQLVLLSQAFQHVAVRLHSSDPDSYSHAFRLPWACLKIRQLPGCILGLTAKTVTTPLTA